jgi:hypothetical protein
MRTTMVRYWMRLAAGALAVVGGVAVGEGYEGITALQLKGGRTVRVEEAVVKYMVKKDRPDTPEWASYEGEMAAVRVDVRVSKAADDPGVVVWSKQAAGYPTVQPPAEGRELRMEDMKADGDAVYLLYRYKRELFCDRVELLPGGGDKVAWSTKVARETVFTGGIHGSLTVVGDKVYCLLGQEANVAMLVRCDGAGAETIAEKRREGGWELAPAGATTKPE